MNPPKAKLRRRPRGPLRLAYRIWRWIFPPRASVRTWMFLTFALFVGLAVLGTGLYTGLVLHGRLRSTMEQTLRTQAERLLYQVVPETPLTNFPPRWRCSAA